MGVGMAGKCDVFREMEATSEIAILSLIQVSERWRYPPHLERVDCSSCVISVSGKRNCLVA